MSPSFKNKVGRDSDGKLPSSGALPSLLNLYTTLYLVVSLQPLLLPLDAMGAH